MIIVKWGFIKERKTEKLVNNYLLYLREYSV
jgi:hypothetical protein